MRVADAIGAQLDWMVAKCEDKNGVLHDDGITRCIVIAAPSGVYKGRYAPSTDWAQGGPILDRERITIRQWTDMPVIHAYMPHDGTPWGAGPTPLIAAMRCYVASKLGREVEVPEELI